MVNINCTIKLIIPNHCLRRHDNEHDDIQHNNTEYNDTQHNDTQHKDTQNCNKKWWSGFSSKWVFIEKGFH